jgi:hypothetical protein
MNGESEMKRLKIVTLAIVTLAAVAATSASAALPVIRVPLPGDHFPVLLDGAARLLPISLSTALSAPVTSKEVKLSVEITKEGAAGTYRATFAESEFEGERCNTEGDADGVILVTGNFNFVVASVGQFAALFSTPKEFTISCGPLGKPKIKFTITGGVIGAVEVVGEKTETTEFRLNLKCTKPKNGKQWYKEFVTDLGGFEKETLKANLGLGNEAACEEVEPFWLHNVEMFEFLNI